jgi:sulfur-oxidizing protein SoxA
MKRTILASLILAGLSTPALALDATASFAAARETMEQDNPAELFADQGEVLWTAKRGPKNISLSESCDLGDGIGKIAGYARFPRYFADTGKVMDAERRVVWCMTEKQGLPAPTQSFSNDSSTPDQVLLVTYLATQAKNTPLSVDLKQPETKRAYELGQAIFKHRAGPFDFSCQTCHGDNGKRIRMQDLPNLEGKEAFAAAKGWPGYRMTGGFMLTQQWRMNDCFRQQRFPEPKYLSDSITALLTYLTANANGQVYSGPGIKR